MLSAAPAVYVPLSLDQQLTIRHSVLHLHPSQHAQNMLNVVFVLCLMPCVFTGDQGQPNSSQRQDCMLRGAGA
jgi:hypothetical protein